MAAAFEATVMAASSIERAMGARAGEHPAALSTIALASPPETHLASALASVWMVLSPQNRPIMNVNHKVRQTAENDQDPRCKASVPKESIEHKCDSFLGWIGVSIGRAKPAV